jgi:putative chitinase
MILKAEILKKVCPYANIDKLNELIPFLNQYMNYYQISTPQRVWHFIAQAAHESNSFNTLRELYNGNPKDYFQKYEGRKDLGNIHEGDGEKFKGRGIFQTTGRFNYERTSMDVFKDKRLIDTPELLEFPEWAVLSACYYWNSRHLNSLADTNNIRNITLKINGGLNGINERMVFYDAAKKYINSECFIIIPNNL